MFTACQQRPTRPKREKQWKTTTSGNVAFHRFKDDELACSCLTGNAKNVVFSTALVTPKWRDCRKIGVSLVHKSNYTRKPVDSDNTTFNIYFSLRAQKKCQEKSILVISPCNLDHF